MTLSNEEKINITINLLEDLKDKLNYNDKIVKQINNNYNENITKYITFYIMNNTDTFNLEIRKKLIEEVTNIIRNVDFFTTEKTILKYYRELLQESITEGKRKYQTNWYNRMFQCDYNREFSTPFEYMQKYIIYKDNTFQLIDNYKEKIASYYTQQDNSNTITK